MAFQADPQDIDKIINDQRTQHKFNNPDLEKTIQKEMEQFQLSSSSVLKLGDLFKKEMEQGLLYNNTSSFTMQNTFVHSLLDGSEEGKFLALDHGGSNFRVLLVEVAKGKLSKVEIGKYEISEEIRMGTGIALFDYIATCLGDFAKKYGVAEENLPLGFTFSFPMEQSALNSGTLTQWIGQYNADGVEGQNVVKLLNEAISRVGVTNTNVVAILNDTTGTLLRGSLIDKETAISFILGTGSNACYIEQTINMNGWFNEEKQAVLNIEWGPFPDNGKMDFIVTKFDKEIDKTSLHPGLFVLEKFIGGKFFGELVRLVIVDLVNNNHIFNGKFPDSLQQQESFKTAYISEIEKDNLEKSNKHTKLVLAELGIDWYSDNDITIIQYICEELSIRMAVLSATCLAEIVKRIDRENITIAVDGSVYKYHPRLHDYITKITNVLVGKKQVVKLILAEDGSGIGAALVAALVCKNHEISR